MVEAPEEEVQDGTVKLSLMRLTKEEVQWKLVAVAGSLATATAADVRGCPIGDEYSVFRIFTESGKAEQGWVVSSHLQQFPPSAPLIYMETHRLHHLSFNAWLMLHGRCTCPAYVLVAVSRAGAAARFHVCSQACCLPE